MRYPLRKEPPRIGHFRGLSAGTGKLCIFGHLGLVFIWSCFVSCLLLLLYYVICAPVLTEGTHFREYPSRVKLGWAPGNILVAGQSPRLRRRYP